MYCILIYMSSWIFFFFLVFFVENGVLNYRTCTKTLQLTNPFHNLILVYNNYFLVILLVDIHQSSKAKTSCLSERDQEGQQNIWILLYGQKNRQIKYKISQFARLWLQSRIFAWYNSIPYACINSSITHIKTIIARFFLKIYTIYLASKYNIYLAFGSVNIVLLG